MRTTLPTQSCLDRRAPWQPPSSSANTASRSTCLSSRSAITSNCASRRAETSTPPADGNLSAPPPQPLPPAMPAGTYRYRTDHASASENGAMRIALRDPIRVEPCFLSRARHASMPNLIAAQRIFTGVDPAPQRLDRIEFDVRIQEAQPPNAPFPDSTPSSMVRHSI